MSIQALAKSLGISVSTVSRALNGYTDVSAATRARVQAAALHMQYEPNVTAKRLVSGRTHSIMLLTTQREGVFYDYGFSTMLVGLSSAAAVHGLTVNAIALPPGDAETKTLSSIVKSRQCDAFIISRTRSNDPRIAMLQDLGQTFVAHGRSPHAHVPLVDADQEPGFKHVAQLLLAAGHSHFGMINADADFTFSQLRAKGVQSALEHSSRSQLYHRHTHLSAQAGYDASKELLQQHPAITAIICATDTQALGAIAACRDQGKTVGQDIVITGYGNTEPAAYTHPALASIDPQLHLHSAALMQVLVNAMDAKADGIEHEHQTTLIPTQWVNRASSGLHNTF